MAVAAWTPFREMVMPPALLRISGAGARCWRNSRYQVIEWEGQPGLVRLSIKTLDKTARHDWRDFQRIKNELVGPQCEAVEIYPAESRLVDTANQYWLWCFKDGYRIPFGFNDGRVVCGPKEAAKMGAVQRPFEQPTATELPGNIDELIRTGLGMVPPSD